MANRFDFGNSEDHLAWLGQVQEEVLEPEQPIIDAHHHLWMREPPPYLLPEFVDDLSTGHRVVATVFAECHSMYRQDGPEALRPVGESEFVAGVAAMSDSGQFGPTRVCRAMVGAVDMRLGADVARVLEAHQQASGGRFRGVRVSAPWHRDERLHRVHPEQDYLSAPAVRDAIAELSSRGLCLDIWVYHTQLAEVVEIARAFEQLDIVLNHTGVPILGGPYKGREDEAFEEWRSGMAGVARCPNVVLKLGALPIRTRDRSNADLPPSSADIAGAWKPWIDTSIDLFGAGRCLFESNFPVHKNWCSYPVLWNAFKRLAKDAGTEEKQDLFFGTADRVYRVNAGAAAG